MLRLVVASLTLHRLVPLSPPSVCSHTRDAGVNFMEKTIALRNTDITFSIWDLGGQQEYLHMLPLVCNDAVALLFMFDLSRKSTLTSVKNWSCKQIHSNGRVGCCCKLAAGGWQSAQIAPSPRRIWS